MTMDTMMQGWHVVVENGDRAAAVAQIAALEGAGLSVVACGGPQTLPGGQCPVVEGGACPWIEAADVVLHDLDLDDAQHREVLQAVRRSYPDVPIVLEVPEVTASRHATLLKGCHVVYPFDMDKLVGAVIDAASGRPSMHARSRRSRRPDLRPQEQGGGSARAAGAATAGR